MINKKYLYVLATVVLTGMTGCKKYLDAKPDKSLVVPSTLQDLQSMLDNNTVNNFTDSYTLGEASADNYYVTYADWQALGTDDANTYIWGDNVVSSNNFNNEWLFLYRQVDVDNTVLDNLGQINRTSANGQAWDNVQGSALFFRSFYFSVVAYTWANAYDSTTSNSGLGIPLRLTSDFNVPTTRSSIEETYQQIIADTKAAIPLLPVAPLHVLRPSRTAAYALLSRVYLSMRKYPEAARYADSSLALYPTLIDYNTLAATSAYPLAKFNAETSFFSSGFSTLLYSDKSKVDSTLYRSYADNDLRKTVCFSKNTDGSVAFKGNYSGDYTIFIGFATDEIYLTKAEALARSGDFTTGMSVLNTFLSTRWKKGMFVPLVATNQTAALNTITAERRKELLQRDLRWMDIKRLNKEGAGINLTRVLNGQAYNLPANSPKFALPIPQYVIDQTGIQQNPTK